MSAHFCGKLIPSTRKYQIRLKKLAEDKRSSLSAGNVIADGEKNVLQRRRQVEVVTDGSDAESGGETFILDRLAKEAKKSVSGYPDDGESSNSSQQSEMKKKERNIEITRVHDLKDNKIRLTKPLVVPASDIPKLT